MAVLLWKSFAEDASPPAWIRRKKSPEPVPGTVTVTAFLNGWCPAQNIAFERARRVAAEFDDHVVFREIDTSDRAVMLEWGISDGLFIDGREIRTGPPPSTEKIRKFIAKRIGKLS